MGEFTSSFLGINISESIPHVLVKRRRNPINLQTSNKQTEKKKKQ